MTHHAWNKLMHALHGNGKKEKHTNNTSHTPAKDLLAKVRYRFHNVHSIRDPTFRKCTSTRHAPLQTSFSLQKLTATLTRILAPTKAHGLKTGKKDSASGPPPRAHTHPTAEAWHSALRTTSLSPMQLNSIRYKTSLIFVAAFL